ncbi:MAG: hypothetical protein N3A53_02375 [Verrucomicrobiae bacterium]|nr:hypothetical protein [Verrucomicrobiae bacterium]
MSRLVLPMMGCAWVAATVWGQLGEGHGLPVIQAVTPPDCLQRGAEWAIHGSGFGEQPRSWRVVLWDGFQSIEMPVVWWQDHQVRLLLPRDRRLVPGQAYQVWIENRRRERLSNPGITVRLCGEAKGGEVDERARQLVAAVVEAHGGRQWRRLRRLRFAAQVLRGEQLLRHCWYDWEVQRGIVTVQCGAEAVSVSVRRRPHDARTREAWAVWQADSQRLLLPLQLQEPGLRVEYGGTRVIEGRPYEVLRVEPMAGAPLAIAVQELLIEPRTYRVAYSGTLTETLATAVVVWDGYKRVGPLWLATELRGGEQHIRYSDLAAE